MDIIIIIALIAAGMLLFMAEVFLIPGLSLAGIASAGCLVYVNYYAFSALGPTGGLLTLLVSLCGYVLLFIWFLRSKSIDRLALIGNAEINGRIIEVKSADGFLNEHTPIVVERVMEGIIMVRRQRP